MCVVFLSNNPCKCVFSHAQVRPASLFDCVYYHFIMCLLLIFIIVHWKYYIHLGVPPGAGGPHPFLPSLHEPPNLYTELCHAHRWISIHIGPPFLEREVVRTLTDHMRNQKIYRLYEYSYIIELTKWYKIFVNG